MTTNAAIGFGTTLSVDGNNVAELTTVSAPAMNVKMVDVTNHSTSTSAWAEFVAGIKNGGSISLEGNFYPGDSTGQVALSTAFGSSTVNAYVVTLPTAFATSISFSGLVEKYEVVPNLDKQVQFKIDLQVTGAVTMSITQSVNATTIALGSGTLYPGWAAATYNYGANVTASTTTITVTDSTAASIKLYVDGTYTATLSSGVASSAISFASPSYHVLRVECKDTNKVATVYTINAGRT